MAREVAETFQLPEQVVQRLLADAQLGGQVQGRSPCGPGIAEHDEVGRLDVVEAMLVQPVEHARTYRLERDAQQRTDQRRPQGLRPPAGGIG